MLDNTVPLYRVAVNSGLVCEHTKPSIINTATPYRVAVLLLWCLCYN